MTVIAGYAPDACAETPRANRRHYVMCPPKYFTVEYSINPWMDPDEPIGKACQHRKCDQSGQRPATRLPVGGLVDCRLNHERLRLGTESDALLLQ